MAILQQDAIPSRLLDLPWVPWRFEEVEGRAKPAKVPVNPRTGKRALVNRADTWGTLPDATTALRRDERLAGLGVVLQRRHNLTAIDFDDCLDPATGRADDWAAEAAGRLPGTYFERSPSGKGWRGFVEGHPPPGSRKRLGDIEAYTHGRFVTVTGDRLPGRPLAVTDAGGGLPGFAETYLTPPARPVVPLPDLGPVLADDEQLLGRALAAKNGAKFRRLFVAGDDSAFPSRSEADLSLCNLLAFWTRRDPHRMDRLFRRSALMRGKWDAWRGHVTYGRLTIDKAVADCIAVFDPSKSSASDSRSGVSYTLLFHMPCPGGPGGGGSGLPACPVPALPAGVMVGTGGPQVCELRVFLYVAAGFLSRGGVGSFACGARLLKQELGISMESAAGYLRKLAGKGWLVRTFGGQYHGRAECRKSAEYVVGPNAPPSWREWVACLPSLPEVSEWGDPHITSAKTR